MRHGHHFMLLGLVIFVTLLASAAHASGVQVSSSPPRATAMAAVCTPHVAETNADDTHPGVLIAREASLRLQTCKPPHDKDALTTQGFTLLITPASFAHGVARMRATVRTSALVYALHPRPPTLPTHA